MTESDLQELAERIEYDGRLGVRNSRALIAEVRRLRALLEPLVAKSPECEDACLFCDAWVARLAGRWELKHRPDCAWALAKEGMA